MVPARSKLAIFGVTSFDASLRRPFQIPAGTYLIGPDPGPGMLHTRRCLRSDAWERNRLPAFLFCVHSVYLKLTRVSRESRQSGDRPVCQEHVQAGQKQH